MICKSGRTILGHTDKMTDKARALALIVQLRGAVELGTQRWATTRKKQNYRGASSNSSIFCVTLVVNQIPSDALVRSSLRTIPSLCNRFRVTAACGPAMYVGGAFPEKWAYLQADE